MKQLTTLGFVCKPLEHSSYATLQNTSSHPIYFLHMLLHFLQFSTQKWTQQEYHRLGYLCRAQNGCWAGKRLNLIGRVLGIERSITDLSDGVKCLCWLTKKNTWLGSCKSQMWGRWKQEYIGEGNTSTVA